MYIRIATPKQASTIRLVGEDDFRISTDVRNGKSGRCRGGEGIKAVTINSRRKRDLINQVLQITPRTFHGSGHATG